MNAEMSEDRASPVSPDACLIPKGKKHYLVHFSMSRVVTCEGLFKAERRVAVDGKVSRRVFVGQSVSGGD